MFWKILKNCYLHIILLLTYIPLLLIIFISFTAPSFKKGNISNNFQEWVGFDNYLDLWGGGVGEPLTNSILIALIVMPVALSFGLLTAIGMWKGGIRVKSLVLKSSNLLIGIPDILIGVSLSILFSVTWLAVGFSFGFWAIVISHISISIPYVVAFIYPKLSKLDYNLVLAGADLNSTEFSTICKVIIPSVFPHLLGAAVVVFALSFDDYIITNLISGSTKTISLELYVMKKGIKMWAIAFGSIVILISVFVSLCQVFRKEK